MTIEDLAVRLQLAAEGEGGLPADAGAAFRRGVVCGFAAFLVHERERHGQDTRIIDRDLDRLLAWHPWLSVLPLRPGEFVEVPAPHDDPSEMGGP